MFPNEGIDFSRQPVSCLVMLVSYLCLRPGARISLKVKQQIRTRLREPGAVREHSYLHTDNLYNRYNTSASQSGYHDMLTSNQATHLMKSGPCSDQFYR